MPPRTKKKPLPSPDADSSWIGGDRPAEPIAFIAHAGEGSKVVEIWEIRNATAPTDPNAFMVAAYERGKERWVGVMDLRIVLVKDAGTRCAEDIETFAKSSRKTSSSKVMLVEGVFLSPIFKGRGIGVEMYIAAAALARRLGLALAAGSCFDASTSDDAAHVWDSLSFRLAVAVGYASERVAVFNLVTRGLRT